MSRLDPNVAERVRLVSQLVSRHHIDILSILHRGYPDPDFYARILGVKEGWTANDEAYLEQMLKGTLHIRNRRPFRDFAANLILGWVVQDFVAHLLQNRGIHVERSGTDADRRLLAGREVSEEPDLRVVVAVPWYLDVITDYPTRQSNPSFWKARYRCHLRDKKLPRLKEVTESGFRAGVIGIVVALAEYFFLEVTPFIQAKYIETHWAYGGKPAWELNLRRLGVPFFSLSEFPKGLPFA